MQVRNLTFTTHSSEETIRLGKTLGSYLKAGDVIAMTGTLAAGKTTMTKGIALALGVKDTITSPTFCLISEYEGNIPLYHIDVYRLDGVEDFENLGPDDFLYGSGVCIIEWSEKIMQAIPSSAIFIDIQTATEQTRTITVKNWPYPKPEDAE